MHLRPARPGDEMAVASVHVRSWQVAYRGLLPDAHLDALQPADRAARYRFAATDHDAPRTTLALLDGVVTGFATIGPAPDPSGARRGEVYAIYVDPDHWRRGVGQALMADALTTLAGQGHAAAILWMLAGNERADRFYRAGGWTPDGSTRSEEVHGLTVDEVRYRRALP